MICPKGFPAPLISIHAPRTGSDFPTPEQQRTALQFQSTLPARGATRVRARVFAEEAISTHAPRTGSDDVLWCRLVIRQDFNPRSPHGERRVSAFVSSTILRFQPTLPARGATLPSSTCCFFCKFQSTLPARGATRLRCALSLRPIISIHAPRTGSDIHALVALGRVLEISIHAPRTGSDNEDLGTPCCKKLFQSTLPARGATMMDGWLAYHVTFQSTLPARGATYPRI